MDAVTQRETLPTDALGETEQARFFASPRHDDLECLSATFRKHVYAPHAHETYVVGTVIQGCETFVCRGGRHYVGAGDLTFVNPLDVHDGEPFEGGYTYRMSYPSADLMRRAAEDATGQAAIPLFRAPCIRDPEGVALFLEAFRTLEAGSGALEADEALLRTMALLVVRHAGLALRPLGQETGPIERVRALIEQNYADDLSLDDLAREARVPRHLLIRAFRKATGATPHSYLVNRRTLAARALLKAGTAPAEAAIAVGFFDQSHLTRAFKARYGVTPGAYRAAFQH